MKTKTILLINLLVVPFFLPLCAFAQADDLFAHAPLYVDTPANSSVLLFIRSRGCDDDSVDVRLVSNEKTLTRTQAIDKYQAEGGERPDIESVFFEHANKDDVKDLIVLVKWRVEKPALNTYGNVFMPFIYDGAAIKTGEVSKYRDEAAERLVPFGFDGTREGQKKVYKYKTAVAIRKALKNR